MERLFPVVLIVAGALAGAGATGAQVCAPAPGVPVAHHALPSVPGARGGDSRFRHAWIDKAARARAARERAVAARGFHAPGLAADPFGAAAVTGTLRVPVFGVTFANTPADPYPAAVLQERLFDGPHEPMTLAEYFDEVSYGRLAVTGTVHGWTRLGQTDAWYEGGPGCAGVCAGARVGQMITATLALNDAAIDFGQYDNDGPDGIPNSGDDDGFVDVALFVHPEAGGECGNGNLRSHRFSLSALSGAPWITNDSSPNHGFIHVDDYAVLPALGCDGVSPAGIGMYCHQIAHVFGLPDLTDVDDDAPGVGDWCLMGTGAWNTPETPAHLCAWAKDQLGWSTVVRVDSRSELYTIPAAEAAAAAFRLDVMDMRWRRDAACAIAGDYSMRCALSAAEAAARQWPAGDGYGNAWRERVRRSFRYNGAGAVTFAYRYAHDLESGYDFVRVRLDAGGTSTLLATYSGTGAGEANIDLTPLVVGAAVYEISFEMTSDASFADDDGGYPSTCGAFVLDDVAVTGGGENHVADFEAREDGWACDMDDPAEYFLVEHRRPVGADAALHGAGLAVWHVDRDVAALGQDANTGGESNLRPHGVALVQADGLDQLGAGENRGDAGDLFPGASNTLLFASGTVPEARSLGGHDTHVSVAITGTGDPMTATMSGGWPLPAYVSHTPAGGSSGGALVIDVVGSGFAPGATVELIAGATRVAPASVEWKGRDLLRADFGSPDVAPDVYDLLITNPGGGSTLVPAGFVVSGQPVAARPDRVPARAALHGAYPNPSGGRATVAFDLAVRSRVTLDVHDLRGARVRTLVDRDFPPGAHTVAWDGRDDAGRPLASGIYFVRLRAGAFADARKLVLTR